MGSGESAAGNFLMNSFTTAPLTLPQSWRWLSAAPQCEMPMCLPARERAVGVVPRRDDELAGAGRRRRAGAGRDVLERRELRALDRRVVPDHRVAVLEVVHQLLHLGPVPGRVERARRVDRRAPSAGRRTAARSCTSRWCRPARGCAAPRCWCPLVVCTGLQRGRRGARPRTTTSDFLAGSLRLVRYDGTTTAAITSRAPTTMATTDEDHALAALAGQLGLAHRLDLRAAVPLVPAWSCWPRALASARLSAADRRAGLDQQTGTGGTCETGHVTADPRPTAPGAHLARRAARSTSARRWARCAAAAGDPTFRYDGPAPGCGGPPAHRTARRRCGSPSGRPTARSPATAWGPGAAGVLDGLPALLGADDDASRLRAARTRCCATPGGPAPRLAGAAHRPGARGARAGRAGAEGHRPGGLAGLALAGAAVRRAGARPGGPAAPAACRRPRRRRPGPGCRPGTGTAPGSTCPGPARSSPPRVGPAGWRRSPTGRRPRPRRRCGPCPASACGPRPRSASAPSATPTRCRSATSTWPTLVGWALVGEPVDDDAMLELLEPYRGHRYRAVADGRAVRPAAAAARPALRRPRLPRHVADDVSARQRRKSSGSRGGRSGAAAAAGWPTATAPIGSQPAGQVEPSRTTSRQNIVLLTQAEPSPSTARATSRFSTPGAHRDEEHLPLGAPTAARRGSRASPSPTRHGTTSSGRAAQHVAAPGPPRHLLVGEAVPAQVGDPGGEHRVEQPTGVPRGRRRRRTATASCGAGAGAVTAAATARRTAAGSTALVGEGAHGAPRRHHLAGAEPEHVLGRRPHQGRRARAVLAGGPAAPARARRRTAGRPSLPLTRSAADGHLVGDRGDGHRRAVAVPVVAGRAGRRAAARPATPIAWSVCPVRQGRPMVSVTTTATSTPGQLEQPRRAGRAPTRRGRPGSSSTVPGSVPLASTPAAASTSPCRVSTIRVGPRRATTRTVSAVIASSRSIRTARPSALDTTFEVTTTTSPSAQRESSAGEGRRAAARPGRRRRRPRARRPAPRPAASRSPASAARARPSASAARAMAAAAATSGISSGTARQAMPAASTTGDRVGVDACRPASRRAARRRPAP